MSAPARIAVLGAGGILGAALVRTLRSKGRAVVAAGRAEVDARDGAAVLAWLRRERPDALVLVAARTGGVGENLARPAEFLSDNLLVAANGLDAARRAEVPRVLYCSSSAIYGEGAPLPIPESEVGRRAPHPSHPGYGPAKLAGALACRFNREQHGLDHTALVLGNLYGPGCGFDPARANVVPALIARLDAAARERAPEAVVWGTGRATRALLYADDAAEAVRCVLDQGGPEDGLINIGAAREVSIADLAAAITRTVGFRGRLTFDASKPEGQSARPLDLSRLRALGFRERWSLETGLAALHRAYLDPTAPSSNALAPNALAPNVLAPADGVPA